MEDDHSIPYDPPRVTEYGPVELVTESSGKLGDRDDGLDEVPGAPDDLSGSFVND